ncbi:MAG: Uncharacterised protein [Polaribacter sejongensis]|nr:MAG: Uncharacterised protein [Polaribacter sejongensis]
MVSLQKAKLNAFGGSIVNVEFGTISPDAKTTSLPAFMFKKSALSIAGYPLIFSMFSFLGFSFSLNK